ncbi:Deoxyribodipyrimidine photo-lyase [Pseudovibrio axinellae]|uniref:Deoxyribodipyrimidine photo-lyase n=1 Tax=Pseudovibrio axinellae TaxID=989403 RepID=A0A165YZM9_9HYPH|nr:deoxyribodipyrimidine photo-lyase [Pseudovibrio axinellae]KZL19378.1 Deoxyribodipyrimidine photo-lyase [Pseudovibrio axinellae]SEQ38950.1 deoxyribodipyrimidine photo-lyase [Pseudovibrio axinellae]
MALPTVIHWFRQDLRLSDNPALTAACEAGQVIALYILTDGEENARELGGASKNWLHQSLESLNESLKGHLLIMRGDARQIIKQLVAEYSITGVFWNRCYEPWRVEHDAQLKTELEEQGVPVSCFNASLLWEPRQVRKPDGGPYKVFTPFYRKGCLQAAEPRRPLPVPEQMKLHSPDEKNAFSLDDLNLLDRRPWSSRVSSKWEHGEQAAQNRLYAFLDHGLSNYKEGRNFPALSHTSRLSPHLHWGEISPNQIWWALGMLEETRDIDHFRSELGWREFSYSLLMNNPTLPKVNLNTKFDRFPWVSNREQLRAWQRGQTGIPIVDAGMRELWQTGYMHNRLRMITGSFLVKNLLLDWRLGEQWFWDCLVDADLANNSASWQWIAGCGADAAPYFRIFNPVLQGEKFDTRGEYTRRYLPELNAMPDNYLFKPWEAPQEVLQRAGVLLGEDYPHPIVDLKKSRDEAMRAFQSTKTS